MKVHVCYECVCSCEFAFGNLCVYAFPTVAVVYVHVCFVCVCLFVAVAARLPVPERPRSLSTAFR